MTFKLGGAYDPRYSYISLINDRDEEVARYSNYMFADRGLGNINMNSNIANMVDYRADLTRWYGQRLKIRLCDFGTSNWGLLIADSFITYYTDTISTASPKRRSRLSTFSASRSAQARPIRLKTATSKEETSTAGK